MNNICCLVFSILISGSISAQCDTTLRPIVFIHGFLASGDTYASQIGRFIKKGYCENRLFVFDWNSVGGGKNTDSLLDVFIDNILRLTGSQQVDLIGHSAGGGLGRGYLIVAAHAAKVRHYIHLGSRKWFTPSPYFPNNNCLNIYSAADMIAGKGSGDIEGAENLDLRDKDHYEVATSAETFNAIYQFINKGSGYKLPAFSKKQPVLIAGKAVLLGSNEPMQNATIAIYEINKKNGIRKKQRPFKVMQTDSIGRFGTIRVRKKSLLEFELTAQSEKKRTISYFFEPFLQSNSQLYLRGFPAGGIISALLGNLPAKDDQSVIVVYSSSKAMIAGRDSVTINGTSITLPSLAPASKTVISSFTYDDGDGKTSGNAIKQYGASPFLGGVDISLPVNKKKGHIVYYNGRKLVLPAASSKERILLSVFN
jgi:hypothetical protein